MKHAYLSVLALLTILPFNVNAMDVAAYKKLKTESPEVAQFFLAGVGAGLVVSNAQLQSDGGKEFYCQPAKLALNGVNYMAIADAQLLEKEKDATPDQYKLIQSTGIEIVLFYGLLETFPCPSKAQ